ncbi:hypothetical protein VB735_05860 [Halotia wernerae UHCC 0503]|nr:hypothetical protein [Halotia wernerae UHCC 0503]
MAIALRKIKVSRSEEAFADTRVIRSGGRKSAIACPPTIKTIVAIGAAPVIAAGAVVGLAFYGIKKGFGW